MGAPMCRNLARKSGARVLAFDAVPREVDGAAAVSSILEIATADIVFLSLPGEREVRAVCAGLLDRARPGQIVVDCSTSPVSLARKLSSAFGEKGARFADAPVARTRQAAIDGTLSIMVGAAPEVFARLEPLLRCMASEVTHCGAPGAGQGSADSFALRHHGMKALLPETHPERAFPVSYMLKDLEYALALARGAGLELQGAGAVKRLLEETAALGLGEAYHTALIEAVRRHRAASSA